MSKQPYPEHVSNAVHIALEGELGGPIDDHIVHAALTALWDATRIDTVEQLEVLPDSTVLHDGYFSYEKDVYAWRGGGVPYYITNDEMDLPMRVIWWGDSDA